MIVVCAQCKKKLGEKPPYDDKSHTHTYCPTCLEATYKEMREYFKKKGEKKNPMAGVSRRRRDSLRSHGIVVGEIPGQIEEIRYRRFGPRVSKKMQGPYKHKFSSAGTKMLALRDGSILIVNTRRRKLWLQNNAD